MLDRTYTEHSVSATSACGCYCSNTAHTTDCVTRVPENTAHVRPQPLLTHLDTVQLLSLTPSLNHSLFPAYFNLPSDSLPLCVLRLSVRPHLPASMTSSLGSLASRRERAVTWSDVDAVIEASGDPNAYSLGCTSTVAASSISASEWYVNVLLVPHEVLRYLLLMLERALQPRYFQPVRSWKVQRLFRFYRGVLLPYVKEHHHAEDESYFPWIRTRAPLPARLTAEHEGLMTRLDAIAAMESSLQQRSHSDEETAQWATELREHAADLGQYMREHLSEEEECIIPALRDHFTLQEHTAALQAMMVHVDPATLPVAVAVSCAGQLRAGGEGVLALFLADMPPEVPQAWTGKWRSQIEAEMAYLDAIRSDQNDEPPFDKSNLFVTNY